MTYHPKVTDVGPCETPSCGKSATVKWYGIWWCHPHLEGFFEESLDRLKRSRPENWRDELATVAFHRLLAIAQAADDTRPDRDSQIQAALEDLNGAHPDWREWTP